MKHIQTKACREADKRAPYTAATRNKLGCWLREPQQPAKECTDEESDHWPEHVYWWRNELRVPQGTRRTPPDYRIDVHHFSCRLPARTERAATQLVVISWRDARIGSDRRNR